MGCLACRRSRRNTDDPAARAADGQQWKKRRQAKLDGIIGQVVRTKHGVPVPADVVKTTATPLGMVLDYMTAY